jgi:hypothetical protein
MISAPSLRQRLSGNKAVAICLVFIFLYACKGPKQVAVRPPAPQPPVEIPKEDRVEQYDPVKDTLLLVPRDAIKVDTIRWKEDKTPPIVTDEVVRPTKPSKNGDSRIALLMPFNAVNAPLFSDRQDPKLNKFIQYYAGVKMAMAEIDSLGWPVSVHSYDVETTENSLPRLMDKPEIKNAEVIVGPYEKKDVEVLAAFGLQHEIMVVSPWLPAFSGDTLNPFLIQLYAGLSTHAHAITEFIHDEMAGKKVYVVSRDNPVERNRMQLFTKGGTVSVEELVIKDSSPDLVNTNLHALMSDDVGTIFILPYFAKNDETFVNSFLRKLHADKDTREAIVFGMPQWVGYTNLNANYMESLSLHLSISSFIDVASPAYPSFRARFYKRFHAIPDLNAFLGYDLMMWLAGSLTNGGQEALIGKMDPLHYGLASGFDIRPVYRNNGSSQHEMNTPLYYENKRIRILRFVDQDFVLAR